MPPFFAAPMLTLTLTSFLPSAATRTSCFLLFWLFAVRVINRFNSLSSSPLPHFQNLRFAYGNTTQERMKLHKMTVKAIAVIHQYDYKNGHPPFEVC
jgi:hypothetical protein